MAGLAQLVEHQIVDLGVAGPCPASRPNFKRVEVRFRPFLLIPVFGRIGSIPEGLQYSMVLKRTNDSAVEAFSPKTGLRFLYADVSETAGELVRRHGCAPSAAIALGKILAGTGILSIDHLDFPETLAVDGVVDGRLAGFHTEVDGGGHLRGYVFESDPDTLGPPFSDPNEVYGTEANVKVTKLQSDDGAVRSQVAFSSKPALPEAVFSGFLASNGAPTRMSLVVTGTDVDLDRARGLAVQCLPNGSKNEFRRVSGFFQDGTIADTLAFDATLATLREVLGLYDLVTGPTRAIALGCTCSEQAVLASYASLPKEVLQGWIRALASQTFRCHLCGRTFVLSPETLAGLLQR